MCVFINEHASRRKHRPTYLGQAADATGGSGGRVVVVFYDSTICFWGGSNADANVNGMNEMRWRGVFVFGVDVFGFCVRRHVH